MNDNVLPVLIGHDIILFPSSEIRLEFSSIEEKELISLAETKFNNQILVAPSLNPVNSITDVTDLPNVLVVGIIKMRMDMPNGKTRVVIDGMKRVTAFNYMVKDNVCEAIVKDIEEDKVDDMKTLAYSKNLIRKVDAYIAEAPYMGNALLSQINENLSLDTLTDIIASFMPFSTSKKIEYIMEINPYKRVEMLLSDINEDLEVLKIEQKLDEKVNHNLEKSQKEYILREKIKVIKEELGEKSDKDKEIDDMMEKINNLKCSSEIRDRLLLEVSRYENCNPNSPELGGIRDYINWLLKLPWCNFTEDLKDLDEVLKSLDKTHYGLVQVKDRIIEYLAVKQNAPHLKSPIICLVGPPGVGKTSLAISIAKSLGREVTKISVGGINDEAEIVGHRRTYIGSSPGRIIKGMVKAGTTNPVFIIDEIDKMTKDIKGDPASSLLEVLDPEQNSHFSDHYIEEDFDLSNVIFIATANYLYQIPEELRDRLEIIEITSYTEYEKLDIAIKHLIPKELANHGLSKKQIDIKQGAILNIIRYYTKEAGVRELERLLATIFRKVVKDIVVLKNNDKYVITPSNLEKYLGVKKYNYLDASKKNSIGVVNGMAYTPFGGDILPIETTLYKGNGNLILTGSLGQVMKESAHLAFSYIKAHCGEFQIDRELIDNSDIHIHLPEGAITKDGPSAGVALATSLISLLTNRVVPANISMTGEMTLQGKILPIGGLKEKVLGAHRNRIKKIYLPLLNKQDLEEVPEEIQKDIEFVFVNDYIDIYIDIFNKIELRQEAFSLF